MGILLTIKNLQKTYQTRQRVLHALNGVSLDIYKQEIISLLGVNGAGKTTLSSIIATLHPPTSGDIIMHGSSIYKNINSYRRIIGFCPQKSNLNKDLTVEQILTFTGKYYGLPEKVIIQKREELIEHYELQKYRTAKPDILSGGYAHRVLLARSLIHNPKLLILDEPTVGLDPHIRRQLWDQIKELKRNGVSILLTTHYLDEADVLSDRICILDSGMIKLISTPAEMKEEHKKTSLEDIFIKLLQEEVT
jgi:ABC-type multidrug transport system ATPase subunit